MEVLEQGKTSIMSNPAWDSIPQLALKSIFNHLKLKDVLSASSTCQHWRGSLLMYEGRRDCLKLNVQKDVKKHVLLTRIFKKNIRALHVYITTDANQKTLNHFMCQVLPQFLDTRNLQEVYFIGPMYMIQNRNLPYAQLRRVIFETLVYKHAHVLEKLAVFGCGIDIVDDDDRHVSNHMAYYSKPLSFHALEYLSPTINENSFLSRDNVNAMTFSNINHIVIEYELISTKALTTLSKLDNLKLLSLNIIISKKGIIRGVDWSAITPLFTNGLQVAVNIIALPPNRVQHLMDNAFTGGMPLISFKAMFCKIFYMKLVHHVISLYQKTLIEFSWSDRPTDGDKSKRLVSLDYEGNLHSAYHYVNPFVFLVWQCKQLRKLAIHGYWVGEYDIIGISRLREGIELDVSAVHDSPFDKLERPSEDHQGCLVRVMKGDAPPFKEVLKNYDYRRTCHQVEKDQIGGWDKLPLALRAGSTRDDRLQFIISEVMHPFGIT